MRRILPIVSIILLTAISSQAQTRPLPDGAEKVIKFYPNPAVSFITFDFQKDYDKGYNIQVYSFIGKLVFEAKNVEPRTTVNLSEYNRGVYIYQLRDRSGRVVDSGKFQVAK